MRLIALDTETTGSSPTKGDLCVEVGLVEVVDGALTGRTWQAYINPGIPINYYAQRIHGITNEFLADKPCFADVADDLLAFIGDAPCLAHDARFDRDMILHDFRAAGLSIPRLRFHDTVPFAKAEIQAPAYNLDTLALTLGVTQRKRGLHGALSDATILADIVVKIEERNPGAIARRFLPSFSIATFPSGWAQTGEAIFDLPGLAPTRPATPPGEQAAAEPRRPTKSARLAAIVAEANAQSGPMDPEIFNKLRSGHDSWSTMQGSNLRRIVGYSYPACLADPEIAGMAPREQNAALRWICRGLTPERAIAWNTHRASFHDTPSLFAEPSFEP